MSLHVCLSIICLVTSVGSSYEIWSTVWTELSCFGSVPFCCWYERQVMDLFYWWVRAYTFTLDPPKIRQRHFNNQDACPWSYLYKCILAFNQDIAPIRIYILTGDETQEMERSFHGSISGFALSAEYFACMFEGKIQLMQVYYCITK